MYIIKMKIGEKNYCLPKFNKPWRKSSPLIKPLLSLSNIANTFFKPSSGSCIRCYEQ